MRVRVRTLPRGRVGDNIGACIEPTEDGVV
jgi:hypothetical protein